MQNFKNWFWNESKKEISDLRYGETKQDAEFIKSPTPLFSLDWKQIELPKPPENTSKKTQNELEQILIYQKENNQETKKQIEHQDRKDVESCFLELLQSLGEKVDENRKKQIIAVSEQLSTISLRHKIKFNRARPFQLLEAQGKINPPKGRTTKSPSYPSTHALIGAFLGSWLASLYPQHKKDILKLGKDLGDNRVKAGFHFQSDCDAGNWLAEKLKKHFKLDWHK